MLSKLITPASVLFATALVMLVACGANIDAGRVGTAIVSGIGSFVCLVSACVKDATS